MPQYMYRSHFVGSLLSLPFMVLRSSLSPQVSVALSTGSSHLLPRIVVLIPTQCVKISLVSVTVGVLRAIDCPVPSVCSTELVMQLSVPLFTLWCFNREGKGAVKLPRQRPQPCHFPSAFWCSAFSLGFSMSGEYYRRSLESGGKNGGSPGGSGISVFELTATTGVSSLMLAETDFTLHPLSNVVLLFQRS